MSENTMIFIWLGLTIVFAVIEAATAQLATVWFALGSVVSLIVAACGVKSVTVQVIVFVAVSLISLMATRPFVKKIINKRIEPTNADRNIGETGVTVAEINNIRGTGEVNLKGTVWTARSEDGSSIPSGVEVTVQKIEGVKLIVKQK
ncbi:MAG: NfeD family protein [Oscillospiraceae bacterium]|nr:NfeD family protein [Oscillospiraceae bacterium]